jgi:hypothetical protein
MTDQSTSVTTAWPTGRPDADRQRLRAAGLVLLLGGLVFFAGVSRPVVTDWATAWDSPDTQLLVAQASPGEFQLGFVLMGLGYVVMGIGAGLLLLAMQPLFTGRKAQLARVFAWVAIAGGLIDGGHRAVLALVDYEAMAVDRSWIGAVGTLALGLGFAGCGLITWRGPVWRWPSLAFAVLGLVGTATIPAVFMFAALAYGLLVIIQFRRGHTPRVQRKR